MSRPAGREAFLMSRAYVFGIKKPGSPTASATPGR